MSFIYLFIIIIIMSINKSQHIKIFTTLFGNISTFTYHTVLVTLDNDKN